MPGTDKSHPCLTTYKLNVHTFMAAKVGNWTRFQLAHIQVDNPSTRSFKGRLAENAVEDLRGLKRTFL